ncbi:MAG: Maf family protein [Desulfopila sp.]|jgi:septum formation protein|nr:Maf family protein [Desulfopila sp.]
MFVANEKIVLASASPRRQAYFEKMGIDFDVVAARIDETPFTAEKPVDYVARMARCKYDEVSRRFPHRWVITADTIVFLDTEILGKPVDDEDAIRTLLLLSGKTHTVATAFKLGCSSLDICHEETVETLVRFFHIPAETASAYVATGEPADKAGAYGIQGKGAFLVKEIKGSYSNVVGLPLGEVLAVLSKYGIVKTK